MGTYSAGLPAFLLATALVLPAAPAVAQEDGDAPVVIADISCRDLLLQVGQDQERTMSFLHGYAAGSAGVTEVDVEALITASGRFLEACIEAPDTSAIDMLRDVLG